MKRVLLPAIAAAMLLVSPLSATAAAEQDVAKITCKEFLDDRDNRGMMIMWIDGYISGKDDNTVLSDAWIEKLGTHLGMYCGANPAKTIMDAINAMPSS